jgi:hypothetical protein
MRWDSVDIDTDAALLNPPRGGINMAGVGRCSRYAGVTCRASQELSCRLRQRGLLRSKRPIRCASSAQQPTIPPATPSRGARPR